MTTLHRLIDLGFDDSTATREGGLRSYRVRCSACSPLVINGVPVHERGCRNEVHECLGCWNLIPARQRYCADCMS